MGNYNCKQHFSGEHVDDLLVLFSNKLGIEP